MEKRRQDVRLPTAERRAELEYAVVARSFVEGREDLLHELLEIGRQVRGSEEGLRVPVHDRDVGIARGNGAEIDGKDGLRGRAPFDIGVQLHKVGPWA